MKMVLMKKLGRLICDPLDLNEMKKSIDEGEHKKMEESIKISCTFVHCFPKMVLEKLLSLSCSGLRPILAPFVEATASAWFLVGRQT